MKHYLILLAGLIGAASSVFFIKDSKLEPSTLSAVRLLGSAGLLLPFAVRHVRSSVWPPRRFAGTILPAAIALAFHYLTWFIGVRLTSAAMSTLIVNLTPVLMPFLMWTLLSERINRGEVVGSCLAIAGVFVLALSHDSTGETTLSGILICVGSIALCTLYLGLGRKYARGRPLFGYIVPLYFTAGLLSLIGVFARHETLPAIDLHQVLVALGAIIFPTVIGHTALNYSMVHLPAQVVSISCLGQFVVVAILAMPIRHEYPTWNLVIPSILVIAGAWIVIKAATPAVQEKMELVAIEPAGT